MAKQKTKIIGTNPDGSGVHKTQRRTYAAHHMLLRIVNESLKRAESKQPGWRDEIFTVITLSALATEGLCNAIGTKIVMDWNDFETARTAAKLRMLCATLNLPFDRKAEPWSTAIWLASFRNEAVHPKPEPIEIQKVISNAQHEQEDTAGHIDFPNSKFELKLTISNAKRAVTGVRVMRDTLLSKLELDQSFGLANDCWEGNAKFLTADQISKLDM